MYPRFVSVFLVALVGMTFIPTAASAQCCECFENPIAGLHKCPEQLGGRFLNPHYISTDGQCAGFHGHTPCGVSEEDAQMVNVLKMGEPVEMADVNSLLRRNPEVLSLAKDRNGIEMKGCEDPTTFSFIPLPPETWRHLNKNLGGSGRF